ADTAWLGGMAAGPRLWGGSSHRGVSQLLGVTLLDGRLVFGIDDDRGPTLAAASAHLADRPADRERWTVAQIIAIARGLDAMNDHLRARLRLRPNDLAFIHRSIVPHN